MSEAELDEIACVAHSRVLVSNRAVCDLPEPQVARTLTEQMRCWAHCFVILVERPFPKSD